MPMHKESASDRQKVKHVTAGDRLIVSISTSTNLLSNRYRIVARKDRAIRAAYMASVMPCLTECKIIELLKV